ncbi:CaiB/BaiF CoA transferase family protein [Gordonia sp. KTR9]|uniref:CaiB/BaiF CoA transferase family protein n=1 Tax=Gordonia sp. KTR9 TaxID=337191 RepID=UPI00027DDD08|nr:CaiB/BaiF CoA-transferase family protein [Gordonia sp. KTR9]AFR47215.1 putative acyl-CoA transferases/carnitine dehydratase [Gordonia sp. KTR9]
MSESPTPPLAGTRIIELAGIGPGPFAAMMLADMGAEVITVDRPGGNPWAVGGHGILFRSRRHIAVDLKTEAGADVVRRLCADADGLIETFRPGVAERLGVGPQDCQRVNPDLVYGRMTGWGQSGPMAQLPGHDINYIALTGALHQIGRKGEPPVPPLNLVGDFGGGGTFLAFGMLAGILSARAGHGGRVVDAAMIDGASALMAMFHSYRAEDSFVEDRGANLLDTGAFFYDVYRTRDDKWVSIGAIENQFWLELCDVLGLPEAMRHDHLDPERWDDYRIVLQKRVAEYDRAELDSAFAGRNTCYAPVLTMSEAIEHPHHQARNTFVTVDDVVQPAPAPRFDGQPPTVPRPRRAPGADTRDVLLAAGYSETRIESLLADGVVDSTP